MKTIEMHHVFFGYSANPVLKDISFTIYENEFIAIFGPNGGGKTTLLSLLMGFLRPAAGNITLFGKSPKESRSLLGWVPQSFQFDPSFPISVEEVVLAGRLKKSPWYGPYTKEDRRLARECLQEMGIEALRHDPFSSLSGGQQQRVLIARALVSKPAILLLDEPTASIDTLTEVEILKMLQKLKNRMTILMVTHELKMAVERVDRLFCVQKTLFPISHAKVCEHYALGLYHPPENTL